MYDYSVDRGPVSTKKDDSSYDFKFLWRNRFCDIVPLHHSAELR